MLEYFDARFQIKITFRKLKQDLGAFRCRIKSNASFGRYLQIVFVAYALEESLFDGLFAYSYQISLNNASLKALMSGKKL